MRTLVEKKIHYSSIFWLITALLFAILLSRNYRNYIFSTGINDFGLAGSGPGFFALMVCFFGLRLLYPQADSKIMLGNIYGLYLIQEFLSLVTDIGTFDWIDLVYYTAAYFFLYSFLSHDKPQL